MDRPPRSLARRLLDGGLLVRAYGVLGVVEAALALGAFAVAHALQGGTLASVRASTAALLAGTAAPPVVAAQALAVTATFAAIVASQVGNVLACRSETIPATRLHAPRGPLLAAGVAVELVILLAVVYAPPLQRLLGTAPLPPAAWGPLALCPAVVVLADTAWKRAAARLAVGRRRGDTGARRHAS